MTLLENIRIAWEGLKANKMRALLTMLGIIIGIGSVIGILTVGGGMSSTITDAMGSLGATNIMVSLQMKSDGTGGRTRSVKITENDLITDDMVDKMRERFPEAVAGVSISESVGGGQAKEGHDYANVSITGVNADYEGVNNISMVSGRFLNEQDMDGKRSTAVVSDKLVNNMFRGDARAAVGEEIKVRVGTDIFAFRIVGVYKYEQTMMSFSFAAEKDISTSLYIPVSTAKKLNGSPSGYQNITVMASASVDSLTFASQLSDFYNRYYENNANFRIMTMSMESITEQFNTMMNNVNIALSVIAGISLLVGGIGVMNIMLVSVTERTREIGTRKALGATNGNIRVQFVVESTIVCLIGGVFGVIFGGILGYIGSSLLGVPSGPSLFSILLAVGFSMFIGVFFGYYPANKAAMLDPIEALRYE